MSHDPKIGDALSRRENEIDSDSWTEGDEAWCYVTVGVALKYRKDGDRGEAVGEVLAALRAEHGKQNIDELDVEDGWWPPAATCPNCGDKIPTPGARCRCEERASVEVMR